MLFFENILPICFDNDGVEFGKLEPLGHHDSLLKVEQKQIQVEQVKRMDR